MDSDKDKTVLKVFIGPLSISFGKIAKCDFITDGYLSDNSCKIFEPKPDPVPPPKDDTKHIELKFGSFSSSYLRASKDASRIEKLLKLEVCEEKFENPLKKLLPQPDSLNKTDLLS